MHLNSALAILFWEEPGQIASTRKDHDAMSVFTTEQELKCVTQSC